MFEFIFSKAYRNSVPSDGNKCSSGFCIGRIQDGLGAQEMALALDWTSVGKICDFGSNFMDLPNQKVDKPAHLIVLFCGILIREKQ